MTEPPIESDRTIAPRRWLWWWIALLAVVLVAVGAALWLRQSATAPPPAPTSVADVPRPGETPALPVTDRTKKQECGHGADQWLVGLLSAFHLASCLPHQHLGREQSRVPRKSGSDNHGFSSLHGTRVMTPSSGKTRGVVPVMGQGVEQAVTGRRGGLPLGPRLTSERERVRSPRSGGDHGCPLNAFGRSRCVSWRRYGAGRTSSRSKGPKCSCANRAQDRPA